MFPVQACKSGAGCQRLQVETPTVTNKFPSRPTRRQELCQADIGNSEDADQQSVWSWRPRAAAQEARGDREGAGSIPAVCQFSRACTPPGRPPNRRRGKKKKAFFWLTAADEICAKERRPKVAGSAEARPEPGSATPLRVGVQLFNPKQTRLHSRSRPIIFAPLFAI